MPCHKKSVMFMSVFMHSFPLISFLTKLGHLLDLNTVGVGGGGGGGWGACKAFNLKSMGIMKTSESPKIKVTAMKLT